MFKLETLFHRVISNLLTKEVEFSQTCRKVHNLSMDIKGKTLDRPSWKIGKKTTEQKKGQVKIL